MAEIIIGLVFIAIGVTGIITRNEPSGFIGYDGPPWLNVIIGYVIIILGILVIILSIWGNN